MTLYTSLCTMGFNRYRFCSGFSHLFLKQFNVQTVRQYFGKEFLSPIEQFALDGYDDFRTSNVDLNDQSTAIILGGYLGDTAQLISSKFGCLIHIIEPVPDFVKMLKMRFATDLKIQIHEFAASSDGLPIKIFLDGDATSSKILTENAILVKSKKLSDFMNENAKSVDLLEMNIEGGEYEVFEDLFSSKSIMKIQSLMVQFHNVDERSDLNRAIIRNELNKTHDLIYCYDWVWEFWRLKESR